MNSVPSHFSNAGWLWEGDCGRLLVLLAVAFEDGGWHRHGKSLSGIQVFARETPCFLGFWFNFVQVPKRPCWLKGALVSSWGDNPAHLNSPNHPYGYGSRA